MEHETLEVEVAPAEATEPVTTDTLYKYCLSLQEHCAALYERCSSLNDQCHLLRQRVKLLEQGW